MIKIKKYPFIKQEEIKDCGAACLSMIIQYYNGYLNIEKIRELLKIDNQGTTAYHIVEGAKKIGFESKGVQCELDDINEDNIILPCIANVIVNKTYRHFVVIYKIDFINNKILIADPSNKIITMSFDIFKSIFSGIIIMLYPNQELPHEKKENYKLEIIKSTIKSHPKLIKNISIFSLFITIFSIISSFFLEKLNTSITIYKTQDIIIFYLLFFLIIAFLKCLTQFFREKLIILVNEKINLKLTIDTFKKVLLLPYKNYRSKSTGDIVTRILDVGVIKDSMSKIFITILVDLPLALISMIILVNINPRLFIISFIILILYIIVMFAFKDYFDTSVKTIKKNNVEVTNFMLESINNYETVKGLKVYDTMYNQFERKFVKLLKSLFSYDNIIYLQQFLKNLISECGLLLIYGLGGIMVVNGKLSFSSLLTFGALLNYYYQPIQNIVGLESDIRSLDLIISRLSDLEIYNDNNGVLEDICKGDIIYSNLNYTYNDKVEILKHINLKIKFGEKVIVLGKSGSGKSTLVKLLLKYYDVSRNNILINGVDINDYNNTNGIIYISQTENLFTDTLYNNLTLYEDINSKNILETCKLCEVDEMINDKELGYNLLIEENGFNLSGGERQRIVLARSLLKKFNILIIDEGLNQMDIDLERRILKRLFEKYKNKTIIIISHRHDNLDLYDRKLVLENGEIKENVSKI